MSWLRSRRVLGLLAVIVVVALFLIRPGANRLKQRIRGAISAALARRVEIGHVYLQLLPQPGFELDDFVIYDDPGFSPEPMLRASEVSAVVRLTSLLRGRLEIARLSLTDPSLNLVRDGSGRWNLEDLLERSSRIVVAPTTKPRLEPRPGFPYIEATGGRINFKFGSEKEPGALTETKFALWQDSDNTWGMSLKGRPLRTDLNVSDTGQVAVSGVWQRAGSLRETPLKFNLQWDEAQLGQLTKLVTGNDKGWRGAVAASLDISGSPADLQITAGAEVRDFRRYDIVGRHPLRLAVSCAARYHSPQHSLTEIVCQAPAGEGEISLRGSATAGPPLRTADLALVAERVPMQALANAALNAKLGLPADMTATGTLDAKFELQVAGNGSRGLGLEGKGEATDVRVRSSLNDVTLNLGKIPFSVGYDKPASAKRGAGPATATPATGEPRLEVGPFAVALGRPAPVQVRGWFSSSGYSCSTTGEAELKQVLAAARTIGMPAAQAALEGAARFDLTLAGQWQGFAVPRVTGTAQLTAVRAEVRGLNAPVQITSAKLLLADDATRVQNLAVSVADGHWTGSLAIPRRCSSWPDCLITFDLHADSISAQAVNDFINPRAVNRPWYRLLTPGSQSGPSVLAVIHAEGTLSANKVVLGSLAVHQVSALVKLQNAKLHLDVPSSEVLGGQNAGAWEADFGAQPPVYTGGGGIGHVSLGQLAQLMHDPWITGTADAKYGMTMKGYSAADFLASSDSSASFDMREGALAHLWLGAGNAPTRVRRFQGELVFKGGRFGIQDGLLEAAGGAYKVTGTVTPARVLNLKIAGDGGHSYNLTGTLSDPRVSPATAAETQAALKR